MFDISPSKTSLHIYFQEHAKALQHAALLLGGRSWLRRCQRLIDDFNSPVANQRLAHEVRPALSQRNCVQLSPLRCIGEANLVRHLCKGQGGEADRKSVV